MWTSRIRLLNAALLVLVLSSFSLSIHGETLGKECQTNADCGDGASCVAGDSEKAIQRCVAGQACGGPTLGGCPSDSINGPLACIWRPVYSNVCQSTPSGCKQVNGQYGIYKCISMDRCDQYFGNGQCSTGCSINGKQCNGHGVCQWKETNTFQCTCESGWNGTRCDQVINDSCIANVGQCGAHGTCIENTCSCNDNYTGKQCEIKPGLNDTSSSSSNSTMNKPSSTTKDNKAASDKADTSSIIKDTKSTSVSPTVIIFTVLAAVIVVGALVFMLFARRKRQQQEATAEADGTNFNRASSIDGTLASGAPTTPKQKIVIM